MTPQERVKAFLTLAPIIYGRYWRTECKKALGVSRNTIRNWRLGNTAPDEATIALLEIYANKRNKNAKSPKS